MKEFTLNFVHALRNFFLPKNLKSFITIIAMDVYDLIKGERFLSEVQNNIIELVMRNEAYQKLIRVQYDLARETTFDEYLATLEQTIKSPELAVAMQDITMAVLPLAIEFAQTLDTLDAFKAKEEEKEFGAEEKPEE